VGSIACWLWRCAECKAIFVIDQFALNLELVYYLRNFFTVIRYENSPQAAVFYLHTGTSYQY